MHVHFMNIPFFWFFCVWQFHIMVIIALSNCRGIYINLYECKISWDKNSIPSHFVFDLTKDACFVSASFI